MTGFGAASLETTPLRASVTARSLNHRFLDVSVQLPRRLQPLESAIRERAAARVRRGRVEVHVQAGLAEAPGEVVVPCRPLVASLVRALRDMQNEFGLEGGVAVSDLVRVPGALERVELPAPLEGEARDALLSLVEQAFDGLDAMYQEALGWTLRHRKTVVVGVLLLFAASLALVPLVGTEFFPASDESQFRVFVRAPIGTRVEETEKVVARIEEIIRANLRPSELKTIVASVGIPAGRSAIFTANTGPHAAQVQVYLETPDRRTRSDVEIVAALRPRLVPGCKWCPSRRSSRWC